MTQTVFDVDKVHAWARGLSGDMPVKPLMPVDGRVLVGKQVGNKLQQAKAVALYPGTWQGTGMLARDNPNADTAHWYAPTPLVPAVYHLHTVKRNGRGVLVNHWNSYVLVVPASVTLTKGGADPQILHQQLARLGLSHAHMEDFILVAGAEFALEAATLAMTAGAAFQGNAQAAARFLNEHIASTKKRKHTMLGRIGFKPSATDNETLTALFFGAYEFARLTWTLTP